MSSYSSELSYTVELSSTGSTFSDGGGSGVVVDLGAVSIQTVVAEIVVVVFSEVVIALHGRVF